MVMPMDRLRDNISSVSTIGERVAAQQTGERDFPIRGTRA